MKVSLFIPCLTDQFFPQSGMNMVRVLRRLGLEVEYNAAQTCCGQPAFNSGYHHEARELAKRFIDVFGDAETIVAPSGSCTTMVKVFYKNLFEDDPIYADRAAALSSRLFEFTQFLVDVLQVEDVGARLDASVTFHDSCHGLRELGIKSQPRQLLHRVRDLRIVEMDQAEVCCGFGGTFAVKHAALSSAMAEEKIASIVRADVDYVVSIDSSCLMNIDGMLRRKNARARTMHIADVLASER